MAKIYFSLLKKIRTAHYPVLSQRVKISRLKKLWIAWHTARSEYKQMQQITIESQ